jgi:hypothetical protein
MTIVDKLKETVGLGDGTPSARQFSVFLPQSL